MEKVQLRDYQEKGLDLLRKSIMSGHKRPICVMPTGAGKTILFGRIVYNALQNGKRLALFAHRRNLIFQMRNSLIKHYGIEPGIIMAGEEPDRSKPVQIISKDTYIRRLEIVEKQYGAQAHKVEADILIIDECHLSITKTYQRIISHYQDSNIIGFTATPCRSDGRGLGIIYDDLIDVVDTRTLMEQGYLVPVRYFVPMEADLQKLGVKGWDYDMDKADKMFNQPKIVGNIVEHWLKYGEDRKTIVFAINVKHSRKICQDFEKHGIKTWHLDAHSSDEERENAFRAMESGAIKIISNVGLYREGLDVPNIGCVIMARPTKSLGLWRQCGGRGLRPAPGKADLILFDFAGIVETLGFLDDKIHWVLDANEKPWVQKRKDKDKKQRIKTCKVCGMIYEEDTLCPTCGSEPRKPVRDVETVDGELKALSPEQKRNKKDWSFKIATAQNLKHYAIEKGYKEGWWRHAYKELFGVWPNDPRVKYCEPKKVTGEPYNLFRYLLIRRAKAYRKRIANQKRAS